MQQVQHLPNRGDVWLVTLSGGLGHEQLGERPALIISENAMNHSAFRMVIAIPITSNLRRMASRAYIKTPEGGLPKDSAIMCDQILRLDIDHRLKSRIGAVSLQTIYKVE